MEYIRLEEDSSKGRQYYKCTLNERATSEAETAVLPKRLVLNIFVLHFLCSCWLTN